MARTRLSNLSATTRGWFHWGLIGLLVWNAGYCAGEHTFEAAGCEAELAAEEPATPEPAHGCHNESGCLCRGATQSKVVTPLECDAVTIVDLAGDDLVTLGPPPVERGLFARNFGASGLLSGQKLRALYATLLI